MAKNTNYDFNPVTPATITSELYTDVNSGSNTLGDPAPRGFKGGVDFVITNSGYQDIDNTGSLGTFTGATVPAITTQTDYELDVTVDGVTYQLATIAIANTDDWDSICTAIQTSLQGATSSTETCAIVNGSIRVSSVTNGVGSAIIIAAGTAGTGSGDLLAVIDALGADYTTSIQTAVNGITLTEGVDYELQDIDTEKSLLTANFVSPGFDIYTRYELLSSAYETGDLYFSYKAVLSYNNANQINGIRTDIDTNTAAIAAGGQVLQQYIKGLELSNNVANPNDGIDIQPGQITDDTNSEYLVLPSIFYKSLGSTFVKGAGTAGTPVGGLDTGTVAVDTFYYSWIIKETSSGDIDVLLSASKTSPIIPSGWEAESFTGDVVLTDGSGNILGFLQTGNRFVYDETIEEISVTSAGTTRTTGTLNSAPPDYPAIVDVTVQENTTGYYKIGATHENDVVPSSTYFTLTTSSGSTRVSTYQEIVVDSSSQIYYRLSVVTNVFQVFMNGFLNPKR